MQYISTRDVSSSPQTYSFSDIVLEGLAPDGGLYLPKTYPHISIDQLKAWQNLSYAELALEIFQLFISDIPLAVLQDIVKNTYSEKIFAHTRLDEQASKITPLRLLKQDARKTMYLQALSNGPTLAFKDIAMQWLARLFDYLLKERGQTLNILGATSGDTGSSAEVAMKDCAHLRVFMLSPDQKMSPFQTAQMYSLLEPNIFNIAIEGVFDDCQDLVKAVSADLAFKKRYAIGTINSINWARLVAQIVYYFYGYLQVVKQIGQMVSFAVPSGNFGNICAGHIARMMGLPIKRLVVASNENDVLHEFFQTGVYRVRSSEQTKHTSSPSMDISKASNFERFIADLVGRDAQRVSGLFKQLNTTQQFDLSGKPDSDGNEWLSVAQYGFCSARSSHEDRLQTIAKVFQEAKMIIDPHTADGIYAAEQYLEDDIPMIVLETAQPAKFNATVEQALGLSANRPEALQDLEQREQRFVRLPAQLEVLKQYLQEHIRDV